MKIANPSISPKIPAPTKTEAELVDELLWWVDFFNIAVFKDQPVPVPVIAFKKEKITTKSRYLKGPNAFGIREIIVFNSAHLERPLWQLIADLLHEMTHSWQAAHGSPSTSWFHNREFSDKLGRTGIRCNAKGHLLAVRDPFSFWLEKHGVPVAPGANKTIHVNALSQPTGRSKLKKWSCGCTNARVAIGDFAARCLKCQRRFTLV